MEGSDLETTEVYEVGDGVLKAVATLYNRTEETLLEDVKILREWMKTQPHLPEVLNDKSIQNFLILNKCSIERTKQKIDMYYTLRTQIPDIYENINPKLPYAKEMMDIGYWVPLPKLTKEMYRVFFYKVHNKDLIDRLKPRSLIAAAIIGEELRLNFDIMFGDIFVFDMDGMQMGFLLKWTPSMVAKCLATYEKVFSMPLKAVYFINSPSFVKILLTILKSIMKPKLFERVHVCQDTSILNEVFPKKLIPKDYGGEEKSLAELQELLKLKLVKFQDRFDQLDTLRVNESLRPEQTKNDDVLGFHGNFKKLDLD